MAGVAARVAATFWADQQYRDSKYRKYRDFSLLMTGVLAVVGAILWAWDYVHDPVGAQHTVWLRASILPCALPYLAALAFRLSWPLAWFAASATIVAWEASYVLILGHLKDSASYGISGFGYFLAMPLLMTRGFVFVANVALTVLIVALPLVLACIGPGAQFQSATYAEFAIPFAVASIATLAAYSQLYASSWGKRTKLAAALHTDPLTGLGNRYHFTEAFRKEIARAQRLQHAFSVILVNIDQLKRINDTHGHPVGDQVIRAVGKICGEVVRGSDIVTRVGGDEFGVILFASVENAIGVAKRIRLRIQELHITAAGGECLSVTVSIGLAESVHSGENLLKSASEALCKAKKFGRNRYALG